MQAEGLIDLKHPVDRYGKQIGDRWTTLAVETALDRYRVTSFEAGKEVAGALRALAGDLELLVADLVSATTFSTVATAVSLHARHAVSRGWRPAQLLPANDASTPWHLTGLVPFWMDRDGGGERRTAGRYQYFDRTEHGGEEHSSSRYRSGCTSRIMRVTLSGEKRERTFL